MKTMNIRRRLVLLIFGLIGWGICGAIIAIGRSLTDMQTTLIIHAAAVPVVFGGLAYLYFRFFGYTTPLQTALFFTGLAIFLDATLIALLVEQSYAMFGSILGTWIPFGLIFLATYLVGRAAVRSTPDRAPKMPAPGAGS
jgi:hypothetical protein